MCVKCLYCRACSSGDGTSCSCDNGGVENPGATDGNYCPCASGEMEIGGVCASAADQERTDSNTCACSSGESEFPGPPAFCAVPATCSGGQVPDSDFNSCACPTGELEESEIVAGVCSVCPDASADISLQASCACNASGDVPTGTWGEEDDLARCCTSASFNRPPDESPPPASPEKFLTNSKRVKNSGDVQQFYHRMKIRCP